MDTIAIASSLQPFTLVSKKSAASSTVQSNQEAPDQSLIKAIADGDRRAMHMLYARHNVRIYRFILRLIKNASLAEDLVSEVFLTVWRDARTFKGKSQVSTWWSLIGGRAEICASGAMLTFSGFERQTPRSSNGTMVKQRNGVVCCLRMTALVPVIVVRSSVQNPATIPCDQRLFQGLSHRLSCADAEWQEPLPLPTVGSRPVLVRCVMAGMAGRGCRPERLLRGCCCRRSTRCQNNTNSRWAIDARTVASCGRCRFWTLDVTTITGRSAIILRQHTTPFGGSDCTVR